MLWCEIGHMQFVDSASAAEAAANSASDTMAAAQVAAYLANKDCNQVAQSCSSINIISTSEKLLHKRNEMSVVNKFTEKPFCGFIVDVGEALQDTTLMILAFCAFASPLERNRMGKTFLRPLANSQNITKSLPAFGDVISALSRITALNRFGHVDEENAKAKSLFEKVVDLSDAIEDEIKWAEDLIRGIIAGNIFDLGFAQLTKVLSKEGMSFFVSCQNLVPRPWVIDDLDATMGVCVRSAYEHSGALDHGRMVYSTCSMTSLKNEAVVVGNLRRGVNQQQNSRMNYWQSRLRSIMKSSTKEIASDQHLQYALQGGIDKLAGIIGLTFGPSGRNIVLDKCGSPRVVNEGVKFGRAIELPHDIGTVGVARIREVFSKTNNFEGDRTTNTLKRGSECNRGTYLDLASSLEGHLESNFGALAIDLHADFSLFFFTRKFDFWPVWDPGDTSAKTVKLVLYFQYKDGKRMGVFVNLFWESSNGRDLLGRCQKWSEFERQIATLEFDRDKKSTGVMVNSVSGKKSLLVKGAVENLLEKSTKV